MTEEGRKRASGGSEGKRRKREGGERVKKWKDRGRVGGHWGRGMSNDGRGRRRGVRREGGEEGEHGRGRLY